MMERDNYLDKYRMLEAQQRRYLPKEMTKTKKYLPIIIIIILPFTLTALMNFDEPRGMIWLLLHQFYYSPLSWLGEPFFEADSEVSFWVLPAGRVAAIIIYSVFWVIVAKTINKIKSNSKR